MWEEALEQAKELDRHFDECGKIKGPVHGVPISVKVGNTLASPLTLVPTCSQKA